MPESVAVRSQTETYQRIVVARHGGPDVLHVVREQRPEPAAGQVRVRILAAGVGFPDLLMREGTYPGGPRPPFTPGYDLVGVVDGCGTGVSAVRPGEVVAALTVWGSYTEFICLPESELVPVPDGLDPTEAVSLVLNYVTAYQMLHRIARVRPGARVLVHGAAGGVGTAALQLGKLAGPRMYGTATGPGCTTIAELGATPIDYRNEDFVRRVRTLTGDGVDVVLDGIGGTVSLRSYRTLRHGGRLVLFGHHATLVRGRRRSGAVITFYVSGAAALLLNLLPNGRRVLTYQSAKLKERHPDWFRADLTVLFQLLAQRQIAPVVAGRIPLIEARRAHEMLGRGDVRGKLVLICTPRNATEPADPAEPRSGG